MGAGTEQNRAFFNNEAGSYDQKHQKTLDQIVEEIRAKVDFIGADWVHDDDTDEPQEAAVKAQPKPTLRFLDYACGTGVVSRALAPYTTQCVGVDLSENMVAMYNTRAENQGLSKGEMHAIQANLVDALDPEPAVLASEPALAEPFDVAGVGLGFHHFDDPALAAQRLAARLRPGGVFFILDFLRHEVIADHAASKTVMHQGFSEDGLRDIFVGAGVGRDFAFDIIGNVVFPAPGAAHGHGGHDGHGHGHGEGHGHDGHGHGHGHGDGQGKTPRRVIIARGTKG